MAETLPSTTTKTAAGRPAASTTALAKQAKRIDLPVTGITDLVSIGQMIAQSGLFGAKNDAQGFVLACTCHQEGMSFLEFKRKYHISNDGALIARADGMLADFRGRGGRYKILENSKTRAAAEFAFEGQTLIYGVTMTEVSEAGYCYTAKGEVKDNWKRFPDAMLWARMTSKAVRQLCPEVNAGMYTPEEVMDFDTFPAQWQAEAVEVSEEDFNARMKAAIPTAPPVAVEPVNAKAAPANVEPVKDAIPCQDIPKEAKPVQEAAKPAADVFERAEQLKAEAGKVDYGVCPVLGFKEVDGKSWKDMPDSWLKHLLDSEPKTYPALVVAYRKEIKKTLDERAKK